MKKIPLIIDTDPGVDDTIAIIMAAASDKYEIKALTATHGNVGLEGTSRNALLLADFLGLNCQVAKGASKPIILPQKDAAFIHGANGVAGYEFPQTDREFSPLAAWDLIYKEAVESNGELVLAVLGPMTNIAIAFMKYPDLHKYIKKIFMMGGSRNFGNHSQNAEFNIWGDPHSFQIVLNAGVPIVMADLIFGNEHYFTGEQVRKAYDKAGKLKPLLDTFWEHDKMWAIMDAEKSGTEPDFMAQKHAIYDATAIGAMLLEDKLVTEDYYVVCETQGKVNEGQTVFDYLGALGKKPNVSLAVKMPMDEYYKLFCEAVAHF